MAGGQQIGSAQGTIIGEGGANNVAATGSESTGAVGTTAPTEIIGLRSRKSGSGSATTSLSGQASNVGIGTITFRPGLVLTGQAITGAQGNVTYRGLALISWNANSESDVAFYTVFHGLTSNPNDVDFESQDLVTTSYQMGGLAPGMTHYFWVSATDTSGNESAKSTAVGKAY
jgi:hypothetical protein